MAAQICETCKKQGDRCYCAPNSTCGAYEPEEDNKQMICYNCAKARSCPVFKTLYTMSNDFCVSDCKEFDEISSYKYREIAKNDDLMHLIYDYFLDNLREYDKDEARRAIICTLSDM